MKPLTRLVVIDGHALLYRAYHAHRNLSTSTGMPSGAFYGFVRSVIALRQRFSTSALAFAFDHGRSWRNDAVPTYKHFDEKIPREDFVAQLKDIQTFLCALGYAPVFSLENVEADDLISVLVGMWLAVHANHKAIIVSSDRDFFQLVSERTLLYDDRQKYFFGPPEVRLATRVTPEHYLAWKALVGDPSDNLPGVPGYGKVKAAKVASTISEHSLTLDSRSAAIFALNMRLMRLPLTVDDLPIAEEARLLLKNTFWQWFTWWMSAHSRYSGSLRPAVVKRLLDLYECKSLFAETFWHERERMRHGSEGLS